MGQLKVFVPGDTIFDFQDETLDSGDSSIHVGGLQVVVQQKVELVVILATLAD
jgi:hypothetical protein